MPPETKEKEAPTDERSILEQLQDQRKELIDAAAVAITQRREQRTAFEARDTKEVTDEERTQFDLDEGAFGAAHDQRTAAIHALDRRIDEEELLARRAQDAQEASRGTASLEVISNPLTYERGNGFSFFRDLAAKDLPGARAQLGNSGDERIESHIKEMRVEFPKIAAESERRARAEADAAEHQITRELHGPLNIRARGLIDDPFVRSQLGITRLEEKRVNPNRLDGQGGFFVPPLWLPEFIPYLRAGRTTADLCRRMPLPEGTDSINLPKIKEPTEVAAQTQDSAPVADKDWTDEAVTANVKTAAGQSDIAIQLLEQSPYHLDEVIMEDLIADLNRFLDRQVISAPGTNTTALNAGLIKGMYPSTNWSANTVTWTEAAPLVTAFNMVMGAMISQIAASRFAVQNVHLVMHPRRWYWFGTGLDGAEGKSGRLVANRSDFGPYNVSALYGAGEEPAEGLVGSLPFGPHNVYIDANIPTKDTSGTPGAGTADIALAAKFDDAWLFEGLLRTRALSEVLSGTLEIRFQVFEYYAFLMRYGQSLAIASGTGFEPPLGALGGGSIKYTSTAYPPAV